MDVPKWKFLLSYLTEVHIESKPGPLNPHLYVSLRKGRFQLCTRNAVYSYEDKYDNFKTAFERLDLNPLHDGEVLILGFGLGSIPIILQKMGLKNLMITGVDFDENVIDLASKYALRKINYPLELVCADAGIFVDQQTNKFDLLAIDVFLDDLIPKIFQSAEFLSKCKNLLKPNGILLYNSLASTDEDKDKSEKLFFENFVPVFPNAQLLDVKGNYIFINDRRFLKKGMKR